MSVDDVRLTRTEAEAQGLIRRDPLRKASDEQLRAWHWEAEQDIRLLKGSTQRHRVPEIERRQSAIRREMERRALV